MENDHGLTKGVIEIAAQNQLDCNSGYYSYHVLFRQVPGRLVLEEDPMRRRKGLLYGLTIRIAVPVGRALIQ